MLKKGLSIFSLIIFLFSCNKVEDSSFSNSTTSSSTTTEVSSEVSTSTNDIDYSLFDTNIIGKWYVHSTWMGILDLNTEIIITNTYEATIQDIHFNFVVLYENYEGACLFESDSGVTKLIASTQEEGVLDWGIVDIQNNQDFGVARLEKHISGIAYSYEGENWPMDKIKEYLGTSKDIPIFEHNYYYLFTGISQLYDDSDYCMIDLFGVSENAREEYTQKLIDAGFVISKEDSTFYTGYDQDHIYAIRLKQYSDNLCIFLYHYSTFYKN